MACGFALAVIASFFPFAAACETLPQDVVRLHVVANSDSEEDQAVKLLVRDAVLEEAARWYGDASSMEEASAVLCTHLQSLTGDCPEGAGRAGLFLFCPSGDDRNVLYHPGLRFVPAACGALPDAAGHPG